MRKGLLVFIAFFILLGCTLPNPTPLPPSPTLIPSPTPSPTPSHPPTPDPIPAELPVRDLAEIAARLGKIPSEPTPTPTPASYHPGQEANFWLVDHIANAYFITTATLSVLTPNFCVWVEKGAKVDQKALKATIMRFEQEIYPRLMEVFGPDTPWPDSCLHIFNGFFPGVGGYFSGNDSYPRQVFPYSNERKVVYINLGTVSPGTKAYIPLLAHELQHLLQWQIDRNEDTWVNEGFSEMAELLSGLYLDASTRSFAARPDTQLTSWADSPDEAYPNYGASFLFMAYFRERFGEEAFRRLVKSPLNGQHAFNEILAPYGLSFEDLFADWVLANYFDDPDSGYGYRELNLQPLKISATVSSTPFTITETVHQYGADYFEIQTEKPVLLRFSANPTVTLGPPSPYSGQFMWWSGRGDESDSTLTRSFDLRNTDKATLHFRAWYDLERDYDYAYLEISSDGGRTWKILEGPHSTSENPMGNNLGYGYTGESGGWVEEVVDLTPWAGKEILLRFECITDDAVNHPGFFLDDISIPEIGYYEDFEGGRGGWIPNGFVYTDGIVRQRWLLQAAKAGKPLSLKRWKVEGAHLEEVLEPGTVLVVSAFAPATTELATYTLSLEPLPPGQ